MIRNYRLFGMITAAVVAVLTLAVAVAEGQSAVLPSATRPLSNMLATLGIEATEIQIRQILHRRLRASDVEKEWIRTGFLRLDTWNQYRSMHPLHHTNQIYNTTTIPLGRCVHNAFTDKGGFQKVFVKRISPLSDSFPVLSQGYSDSECTESAGDIIFTTFRHACSQPKYYAASEDVVDDYLESTVSSSMVFAYDVYFNCFAVSYQRSHIKHALAVTFNWFTGSNCNGDDHVTQFVTDGMCHEGHLLNSSAKSFMTRLSTSILGDNIIWPIAPPDDFTYTGIPLGTIAEYPGIVCNGDPLELIPASSLPTERCFAAGVGLSFQMRIGGHTGHTHPPSSAPIQNPSKDQDVQAHLATVPMPKPLGSRYYTTLFRFNDVPEDGDLTNTTEWPRMGFVELSNCRGTKVTTYPVGRCVRNDFTADGRYVIILAKSYGRVAVNTGITLVVQGYSDTECSQREGKAQQSTVNPVSCSALEDALVDDNDHGYPYSMTSNPGGYSHFQAHYVQHRTPHGSGLTFRRYHKEHCAGAHVDHFVADGKCSDNPFTWKGQFKSFSPDCPSNILKGYATRCPVQKWWSLDRAFRADGATDHLLTDLGLNQCMNYRNESEQGDYVRLLCGGTDEGF
jgi:hypothetical protein